MSPQDLKPTQENSVKNRDASREQSARTRPPLKRIGRQVAKECKKYKIEAVTSSKRLQTAHHLAFPAHAGTIVGGSFHENQIPGAIEVL